MSETHERESIDAPAGASAAGVGPLHDLIWATPLHVVTNKTGVHFLPLVAIGVSEVVVHLRVTAADERKLRRAGWSSQVLGQHLARHVAQAASRHENASRSFSVIGNRAHLYLGPATCSAIVNVLESDQIAIDAAKEEEVENSIETARRVALHLIETAPSEGATVIARSANEGKDVRHAVLEELLDVIGKQAGMTSKVVFLRPTQIQSRLPNRDTLLLEQRLQEARNAFYYAMPSALASDVTIGVVQTVRAMPRNGAPWTGLSLQAKLPGYGPVTAVWNVDDSNPGEKP
jgi:hypothetical protein